VGGGGDDKKRPGLSYPFRKREGREERERKSGRIRPSPPTLTVTQPQRRATHVGLLSISPFMPGKSPRSRSCSASARSWCAGRRRGGDLRRAGRDPDRDRSRGPPKAHVGPHSRPDAHSRPLGHCGRQDAATGQERARTGNDRQTKPARSGGLVKLWSTTQRTDAAGCSLCRRRRGYKNRNCETSRRKPLSLDPPCR
jgi:hypothetical protein